MKNIYYLMIAACLCLTACKTVAPLQPCNPVPEQRQLAWHDMTDSCGLSRKVTLEGLSRGGLFAINWSAKNTDKVACIYVDAPVCDLLSWPGRKRPEWQGMLKELQLTDADMSTKE